MFLSTSDKAGKEGYEEGYQTWQEGYTEGYQEGYAAAAKEYEDTLKFQAKLFEKETNMLIEKFVKRIQEHEKVVEN